MASLAIIGLGLIGGSIAAGLKKRNPDYEIAAWDRNPQSLELGLAGGLIDASLNSAADIDTDLVVLALPVLALEELLQRVDFRDAVVTDVGSVKGHVLETFNKVTGAVPQNFVPGHPIAGSEQHGVAAADPDLFSGHRVILTPLADTDTVAADKVAEMWRELGATITFMTPEHHDQVLAQTSHLPHLLAYALVDTLSLGGDSLEVFQYAAGGFRVQGKNPIEAAKVKADARAISDAGAFSIVIEGTVEDVAADLGRGAARRAQGPSVRLLRANGRAGDDDRQNTNPIRRLPHAALVSIRYSPPV